YAQKRENDQSKQHQSPTEFFILISVEADQRDGVEKVEKFLNRQRPQVTRNSSLIEKLLQIKYCNNPICLREIGDAGNLQHVINEKKEIISRKDSQHSSEIKSLK